ncbi:hypothetical protein LXL04_022020 [Taraxacum kok-saghyz]
MKPVRDTIKITNPMTRSGVWRKVLQVALLLSIHKAPPIMGIDAKSVNKFRRPITELFCFITKQSFYVLTIKYWLLTLGWTKKNRIPGTGTGTGTGGSGAGTGLIGSGSNSENLGTGLTGSGSNSENFGTDTHRTCYTFVYDSRLVPVLTSSDHFQFQKFRNRPCDQFQFQFAKQKIHQFQFQGIWSDFGYDPTQPDPISDPGPEFRLLINGNVAGILIKVDIWWLAGQFEDLVVEALVAVLTGGGGGGGCSGGGGPEKGYEGE